MLAITIHAKASTRRNPGEGALGVVLVGSSGHRRELAEYIGPTEVTRAHGAAMERGLRALRRPGDISSIRVYSDCTSALAWTKYPSPNPGRPGLVEAARPFEGRISFAYLSLEQSPDMRLAKALAQRALGVEVTCEPASRRGPGGAVEAWAKEAILYLADPGDGRGPLFRQGDAGFALSLADSLRASGQLSGRQWPYAVAIALRHPDHVGTPPREAR